MTVLRCRRWRFLATFMFLLHIGMTADTVISPETVTGTLNQPACFNCTTPLLEVHWMMDGEIMRGNSNREDGTTFATLCFIITKNTTVTCYGETTSPTESRSETDTAHVILISEDPTVVSKTVVPTDSGSTSSPTVTAPSNHATPHRDSYSYIVVKLVGNSTDTMTLATPTHPMGGTESGTVATPTSPSGGGCEAGCIADNGTVTLSTPPICGAGCVAGITVGTVVGLPLACLVVLAILYMCWKKPRLVTFCSDDTPVESGQDADIPTPPTSPPVTETNSSRGLSVVMFPEPPRDVRVSEAVSAETETEEGTEFVSYNSRRRQPHSARRRSVDEIASITGIGDNEKGISGSGVQCFASQFGSSDALTVNTTTYSTDTEYLECRPLSTVITMESTAEETQGSQ